MDIETQDVLDRGTSELGIELNASGKEKFRAYMELLQLWGRKMNLTSRLSTKEILVTHFLDSLSSYPVLKSAPSSALIDIGTGAGFPSLPLKICLPSLRLLLVEASHKKASFCREVVRRLDLADTTVVQERGEELGKKEEFAGKWDWVTMRAVGEAGHMMRLSFPFLRPGGTLILYKGALKEKEIRSLETQAARMKATYRLLPVRVPFLEGTRTLVLVLKRST